ncbi:MAG: hypothetical protein DME43_00950 [Verrucomicrobia bacterium]|nr:MAG: hypothetical protein DME43_00950 [Verrucomicrobiota bacterium]
MIVAHKSCRWRLANDFLCLNEEKYFGEAPKWAREARALSRPESHPSEIVWSFGVWCFLEIWILDSRFHRSVH